MGEKTITVAIENNNWLHVNWVHENGRVTTGCMWELSLITGTPETAEWALERLKSVILAATTPAGGDVEGLVERLKSLSAQMNHGGNPGDYNIYEQAATALEQLRAERDAFEHDVKSQGALRARMEAHKQTADRTQAQLTAAQSRIKGLEGALSETLEVASRNELGEYINRAKRALTSKGDAE